MKEDVPVKNPIVPIIMLFVLAVFGIAGYQVFKIFLVKDVASKAEQAAAADEEEKADTGNVFKDLALNHPKNLAKRRGKQQLRQSYNAAPHPHNVQLGNKSAKVRLTIFTDIACGSCRREVKNVLKNVPLSDVHVVFKHAPSNEDDIKSGLFEQIARREGILEQFHQSLGTGTDITDDFMLRTLSALGVSYRQQQELLKDEPGSITEDIDKDLLQGERAGISQLPTFFLNRYRMGPKTLPVENIRRYIEDMKASRPVYAAGS